MLHTVIHVVSVDKKLSFVHNEIAFSSCSSVVNEIKKQHVTHAIVEHDDIESEKVWSLRKVLQSTVPNVMKFVNSHFPQQMHKSLLFL